jgi:diguanylate cyclase (GGDEF)-like protein
LSPLTRKWELHREIQGRLNLLAYYDSLTGLPNRILFADRLDQAIQRARRDKRMCALLFIDLNKFKRINDSLGHAAGDQLLRVMAERLNGCLRESDTVARPTDVGTAARLGGDEFAVILSDPGRKDDAGVVAQRISEQLSQPMLLANHQVVVSSSIGIAFFPDDGKDVETLLKSADLAMYVTKNVGASPFTFYQESMNDAALMRLDVGSRSAASTVPLMT